MSKGSMKRGCGKRVPGGVYLTTEFSTVGTPLKYFIVDPPEVLYTDEGKIWTPPKRGLAIYQRPDDGTGKPKRDVYDWIGKGYEFFPDFYEEGRRFEFSRRASPSLQFELLDSDSWHFYMHPKGAPSKWRQKEYDLLYKNMLPGTGIEVCPTGKLEHMFGNSTAFCTGLLWQLVDEPQPQGDRMHTVYMPRDTKDTFSYLAAAPPKTWKNSWIPAVVLKLPIHKIEVIKDPFSNKDVENYERVLESGTSIPVSMVEE